MRPNLLILGGSREASDLALRIAGTKIDAVFSYAGVVERLREQPIKTRVGGFGGVDGLAAFLLDNEITHIVDATHPFAAQMSSNAVAASARTGVPLLALTRSPWSKTPGDTWHTAPDMNAAIAALSGEPQRIFLAIGRTEIAGFTAQPQHHYVLRLVDAPTAAPPLEDCTVIVDRGPFDVTSDRALLVDHQIDLVVSKNSGGDGARAKIDAARQLGLPVLMIDRPVLPDRPLTNSVDEVIAWVEGRHDATDRGV